MPDSTMNALADLSAELWPAPPDALSVGEWSLDGEDGPDDIRRCFSGTTRGDRVPVEIVGWQKLDGTTGRGILLNLREVAGIAACSLVEVDADTARAMARDLVAAADELEGLL